MELAARCVGAGRFGRSRRARRVACRRAFTLIEVVLTLLLLVAMAALVLPSFQKPFAAQKLRKSGDQLRAAWTSARVQAMSTGMVQAFRYQPGSGQYQVGAWECQETGDSNSAEPAADFSALPYVAGNTPGPSSGGELAERIHFVADEVQIDARAQFLQGSGGQSVVNATDSIRPANGGEAGPTGQPLSTPILFYPDGTTSSARVMLENEYGRQITVELRGLTGVATLVED